MTYGAIAAAPLVVGLGLRAQGSGAEVPAVRLDVRAAAGDLVSPVYEGWYERDGTTYALFGYFNRNLEEVTNIPIGPGNVVAPGSADQGQPTRFLPGRHDGVFSFAVSKTAGTVATTWTLTAHGRTFSIPVSLDRLFSISPLKEDGGPYPGNTPPVVKFEAAGLSAQGPAGITINRTASVSRPLTLEAWVSDDGLPPPPASPVTAGSKRPAPTLRQYAGGIEGVELRWTIYRGPAAVTFSDPTPALEGGKARTTATFGEPGEYMLRLMAVDSISGTKCCWTNSYVRVVVNR